MKIGTVAELRARMGGDEFAHWCIWHALRAQRMQLERMRAKG